MDTVRSGGLDNLVAGDHVALLYRDEMEIREIARSLLDQCIRKRWDLLHISRSDLGNAVSGELADPSRKEKEVKVLSQDDPEFHRNFATPKSAEAYIRRQVASAQSAGYEALCIMREAPPVAAGRSSQKLLGDMAGLDPLFFEKSLIMVCGYRMDLSPPRLLQDVLRTHPKIVLERRIIENLFYIPPSDALRYHLPSLELQHWLDTLRRIASAQEALADSESRFHDILENANDLIQSVGPDGRFLFVNRAWRETLEYQPGEVSSLGIFDIIDPSSAGHCRAAFSRVMAGEDVGRIEAVFRSKSGKKVFVEGNVNCHMRDGKPLYTRAIFRDVTDLKREEMARREREQVLDAVLNLTPHATVVTTPDGIMLYANKPARAISPLTSREGVHGKPFWALLSAGEEEEVKKSMARFLESGEGGPLCRVTGCDGRAWEIEWSRARFGRQTACYVMAVIRRTE